MDLPAEPGVWIGVIAAVVTAGIAAWFLLLRDQLRPRNLGEVVGGRIWRSGRLTPRTLRLVRDRHRIRTVVDLGAYWPESPDEARMQRVAAELGLSRHSLRGLRGDGTGNPNAYAHALRIMMQPDAGPMLVMCAAGADRTGAAVALYRVIVQGWTLDAALDESTKHQHDPARNPAMHAFVRTHVESIRRSIHDGAAIPDQPAVDARVDPAHPHVPASAAKP